MIIVVLIILFSIYHFIWSVIIELQIVKPSNWIMNLNCYRRLDDSALQSNNVYS